MLYEFLLQLYSYNLYVVYLIHVAIAIYIHVVSNYNKLYGHAHILPLEQTHTYSIQTQLVVHV